LTKRGHIEVDDRSNSLIVTDIADRLDQVDAMVRNLDTRTPQVEIVARLVDVDVSSTRDLGIQWGVHNLDLFDAGVTEHVDINTWNRITMDGHPEVSDLASQATVQGGIIINTTMADTRVMVNDGETAVIGGLIRSNESTTKRGVPVLMDVPLLGNLFRSNSTT